jgi:exodeoxyribonuclease X
MTAITVIDVETTGLDCAKDSVVEIAAIEVALDHMEWGKIGPPRVSFVNPHRPIPPEVSAIHHIIDSDVAEAPDLSEALDHVLTPMWPQSVDIIAAHNVKFDRGFLPMLHDKRWLCTWRCAMHVYPDAPSFSNAALFYWLDGKRPADVRPHRGDFDVIMTATILCCLLGLRTLDEF